QCVLQASDLLFLNNARNKRCLHEKTRIQSTKSFISSRFRCGLQADDCEKLLPYLAEEGAKQRPRLLHPALRLRTDRALKNDIPLKNSRERRSLAASESAWESIHHGWALYT